jgi:cell division protein FtsB
VKHRLLSMQQLLALLVAAIGISVLLNVASQSQQTYALSEELTTLQGRRAALQAEIADLKAELSAAQQSGWTELAVKESLHWIRPDETLVVLRFSDSTAPASAPHTDSFIENLSSHWQEWQAYLLGLNL